MAWGGKSNGRGRPALERPHLVVELPVFGRLDGEERDVDRVELVRRRLSVGITRLAPVVHDRLVFQGGERVARRAAALRDRSRDDVAVEVGEAEEEAKTCVEIKISGTRVDDATTRQKFHTALRNKGTPLACQSRSISLSE